MRKDKYQCNNCKSITVIKSISKSFYKNLDYVKLFCCSVYCKKKYLHNKLKENTDLNEDVIQIIIDFI